MPFVQHMFVDLIAKTGDQAIYSLKEVTSKYGCEIKISQGQLKRLRPISFTARLIRKYSG